MSGKGKKFGKKSANKTVGDVTINDFANAKSCKNRSKMSVTSVTQVMKQMDGDDRSWDEKLADFDGDFDFVKEENEDGTTSVVIKRSTSQRRKKTQSELEICRRKGAEYPLDIWFLISDFIYPEDVHRFASICKSTYNVVNSAKFWFNLYKRFYKNTPSLPERLQPECMVRFYSLKACVIRALHYMYPPFIRRARYLRITENQPYCLVGRQCVLMWHTKFKNEWHYYFKLKEPNPRRRQSYRNEPSHQSDLMEMLEDVMANNEEGCRILQVCCPDFVSTPPVVGLTLSSVSRTLSESTGLGHYRLQMGFGSGIRYATRPLDVNNGTVIIIDPMTNLSVLDWWHPLYPHNQTTPFLLNQE